MPTKTETIHARAKAIFDKIRKAPADTQTLLFALLGNGKCSSSDGDDKLTNKVIAKLSKKLGGISPDYSLVRSLMNEATQLEDVKGSAGRVVSWYTRGGNTASFNGTGSALRDLFRLSIDHLVDHCVNDQDTSVLYAKKSAKADSLLTWAVAARIEENHPKTDSEDKTPLREYAESVLEVLMEKAAAEVA